MFWMFMFILLGVILAVFVYLKNKKIKRKFTRYEMKHTKLN